MNNAKTIITGLVTGAIASAATALIIAKVTGSAPPPRCEVTGTTLPVAECALVTRLSTAEAQQRAELADARARIVTLEQNLERLLHPPPPEPPKPAPPPAPAPTRSGSSAKPSGLPFN